MMILTNIAEAAVSLAEAQAYAATEMRSASAGSGEVSVAGHGTIASGTLPNHSRNATGSE